MSSAVEQFTSNLNMGSFRKAEELKQRLLFTLFAIFIYRVGTYIPLPGIDKATWVKVFGGQEGGMLGMLNMFAGGAVERMSIFALALIPYISASIIMQLLSSMIPALEALKKEGGETGRKRLNQYTRYLTIIIAGFQALGLAISLEGVTAGAVIETGIFFRITTIITIVGGTMFLMWLGEQITSRGVGNGTSIIIFAGIVAGIPKALAATLDMGREGAVSNAVLLALVPFILGVIAFVVFMERAQRRVPVQYPKRMVGGNRMTSGENSHMPLKLNTTGVIPPIFASSLLMLPMTITGFSGGTSGDGPWSKVIDFLSRYFHHGHPVYMASYALLIIFFSFFYTALMFNPDDVAENLRKSGGFVPGTRPGKATGDYLDKILTRLTLIGALYLVAVCLLPELLRAQFGLSVFFGGTSLLICVSVPMDTVAQINSHLLAHQYEGLIKKQKLRGSRR
jgi:preprotein translocase subunit SecY